MDQFFEIHDHKNGFLIINLVDFLEILKNKIILEWIINGLEVNPLSEISEEAYSRINEIENHIGNFYVSQKELLYLSTKNIQIVNGKFVGRNKNLYVILEAIDSSYWKVSSNIPWFMDEIKNKFKNIKFL